jgi:hypothetical protein
MTEQFYIGQVFTKDYPPEAAIWCNENRAYIEKDGNNFVIKKCPVVQLSYKEKRGAEYPELGAVIDAICKAMDGDDAEYKQIQAGRLAIKAKYPKVEQ